jgi:hypothetical protein
MLLGVLPLLQLALHVWYFYHVPPPPARPGSNRPRRLSTSSRTAPSHPAPPSAHSSWSTTPPIPAARRTAPTSS